MRTPMSGRLPRCAGRGESVDAKFRAVPVAKKSWKLTRLILWKPYMFSWRTKLENWQKHHLLPFEREQIVGDTTYVVVFEVRTQNRAAELADVRYNEATAKNKLERMDTQISLWANLVPSSVQLMNWADFGSLIILENIFKTN